MKRSEINQIIRRADEFIRARGLYLPPFAYWTPEEWQTRGPEAREIAENQLGWDITDFGKGDFQHYGLFLFTVRNGAPENWAKKEGKLYAEKLMIVEEQQLTPMHFHWTKMEDIINRGGAVMALQLYNATSDDRLDNSPVRVSLDGVERTVPAGTILRLQPGESITLTPRMYHSFWAEGGRLLIGEVSLVNDDHNDNCFLEPTGRFPVVEEDEKPLHLLCGDYAWYYRAGRG